MATISENLQTIKDGTDAIKQAIIDKGGEITGDITTWADAISSIESGGSELSTFTIDKFSYIFQSGMTWEEYINITNPNNTMGSAFLYVRTDLNNCIGIYVQSALWLNGSYVHASDTILSQTYSTRSTGGGGSN